MKAITIKQPWASLIVEGVKDIENRSWKTNYRGRILIHSSIKSANHWDYPQRFLVDEFLSEISKTGTDWSNYAHGAILGSVEIVDCVQNHPSIWAEKGVWNWVLRNPVKLEKPIQCKGKLSLWESYFEICHICGNPTTKDHKCERCDQFYCDDCSAIYDQFSQIDFNCCSKCANKQ